MVERMIDNREEYTTGTGQNLKVHSKDSCAGNHCPIHNPSDHHMVTWKTCWRGDRGIMERLCEHGIGHPDPDDFRIRNGDDPGGHGCDGCCNPELWAGKQLEP